MFDPQKIRAGRNTEPLRVFCLYCSMFSSNIKWLIKKQLLYKCIIPIITQFGRLLLSQNDRPIRNIAKFIHDSLLFRQEKLNIVPAC